MKKTKIKIIFKKLGRSKADGLAYKEDRVIYIDSNLRGVNLLDTILHELSHVQQPDLSEESVTEYARETADILYKIGYRVVDI